MGFSLLARDELADLAADIRRDLDHFVVALAYLGAEKLDDAVELSAHENWKCERAVQSRRYRRGAAHERRFLPDIGEPYGLATRPYPAQQARVLAGGVDAPRRLPQKKLDGWLRQAPILRMAHQAVVFGDDAPRAGNPAEPFAQRLNDARYHFFDAARFGEQHRHGFLNVLAQLRAFALADVREHGDHAGSLALAVVNCRGRHADIDDSAVFAPAHGFDVRKRLAVENAHAVRLGFGPELRRHQRSRPSQHFVFGPAEHALGGGVPAVNFQVHVELNDRQRRRSDQRLDAVGRLLQRLLYPFPVS